MREINKCDSDSDLMKLVIDGGNLSVELRQQIETLCKTSNIPFIGRLAAFVRFEMKDLRKSFFLLKCMAAQGLSIKHKTDIAYVCSGIVKSPEDAMMLIAEVGKPIPSSIRSGLKRCISRFSKSQYEVAPRRVNGVSITDVFNLIRPKPIDEEQSSMFKKIMNGTLRKESSVRMTKYEDIENIIAKKTNLTIGLILKNIEKIAIASEPKLTEIVSGILKNSKAVRDSKRRPIEFLIAMSKVNRLNRKRYLIDFGRIMSALSFASSFSNTSIPIIHGKTAVLIDCSSSMISGYFGALSTAHEKNDVSTAAMYASMILSNNQSTDIYLFSDSLKIVPMARGYSIFSSFNAIMDQIKLDESKSEFGILDFLNNPPESFLGYNNIVIFSDTTIYPNETDFAFSKHKKNTVTKLKKLINRYMIQHPYSKFTSVDLSGKSKQNMFGKIRCIPWHSDSLLDIIKCGDIESVIRGYNIYGGNHG